MASDKAQDGTITSTIGAMVKAGASFLADLLDLIVNGIKGIAPLVLGVGCQSGDASAPEIGFAPTVAAQQADKAVEPSDEPKPIGAFNITFYYVIGEEEIVPKQPIANDNRSNEETFAATAPPEMVTLYAGTGKCEPISEVSREFAQQLELQGTGKLKDGRVLNIWGACNCGHSPCFRVTENQWGTGGSGRPLQPFRTVAVDPKLIKMGSLLYVPLLEGRLMPGRAPWGGFIHDGCVVADDTGGGLDGYKLDLFVGRRAYFLGISGSGGSHAWARHVPVYDGSKICERKGRKIERRAGAI
jgi:3D (Asp-Asp-Asp) domain-containing protein